MYGMLQPVFCNALYSVLRRFVQWCFARPRYICKVLMKNRENMEERFDFADFYESHYRSALRYASMYVFNDEDARDIVSDVLLRFLEQGEKLNRERNVVGLFFSMIYKVYGLSSPQVALQADNIQIEADGRPFFG